MTTTDSGDTPTVQTPELFVASTDTVYFVASVPAPVSSISMTAIGPDGVQTFNHTYASGHRPARPLAQFADQCNI